MALWQFVLFLHILVAIVGLGPTFIFGLIAATGEKEPSHQNFALRVANVIEKRVTIPLTIAMPLLGLWLIYLRDWDLWGSEWLVISIAIYVVAFFVSVLVLSPALSKLIRMTQGVAPPDGPERPSDSGAQEPPPEMMALVNVLRVGGIFESLAIASIVVLMVWKPGAEFIAP